ncbi:MAG: F0F1 ATP synthase subunit epsilon [Pirellula sp.]|jgi:F-type H+-transporting ATPase subunit epsilon
MSSGTGVHCVVVTPEKTELDTHCDSLILPLFDGEIGILPGRSPMVGRLGFGLMKLRGSGKVEEWFVDGGFVQVTREAVYILTDRLLKPNQIDRVAAEADLKKASEIRPATPEAFALRDRALAQARAKLRVGT